MGRYFPIILDLGELGSKTFLGNWNLIFVSGKFFRNYNNLFKWCCNAYLRARFIDFIATLNAYNGSVMITRIAHSKPSIVLR